MVKKLLPILMLAVLAGCSGGLSNATDEDQKEYILTQLNDYQGLIEIYRNKLSVKDDDDDRFRLSIFYNNIGDYSSSNIYLEPLIKKNTDKKYYLLQAKNYLELGQEKNAEEILNRLLLKDSSNGELWNLQGVLLAQQGKYTEAIASFDKARGLFYSEEIVVNNLAMMAILQQDYIKAQNYLLSLYSRKQYRPQTVYNLVYALVKSNDYESARKIIIDEKLSSSDPGKLISSLSRLSPREQYNMGELPQETEKNESIRSLPVKKIEGEVPAASLALQQQQIPAAQNETMLAEQKKSQSHTMPDNKSVVAPKCQLRLDAGGEIKPFQGKIKNAKTIEKLTSAIIENGDRLALYSSYPLNFIILPTTYENQLEVELFSAQPLKSIYQSQLNILHKNPGIHRIEFVNKGDGNAILRISTKLCIIQKKIERSSAKGTLREKIIIDLMYK